MGIYFGNSVYNDSQVTKEWVDEEIIKNGKGVFIAEIGTTPYNDVFSAYNDGKIIISKILKNQTNGVRTSYYPLLEYETNSDEGDNFLFGLATNGNVFTYWNLHIWGGWSSKIISSLVVIDNQLNEQSSNPVSNSAIYAVIGDVETLLADL